jgi:hypothetical protein
MATRRFEDGRTAKMTLVSTVLSRLPTSKPTLVYYTCSDKAPIIPTRTDEALLLALLCNFRRTFLVYMGRG